MPTGPGLTYQPFPALWPGSQQPYNWAERDKKGPLTTHPSFPHLLFLPSQDM